MTLEIRQRKKRWRNEKGEKEKKNSIYKEEKPPIVEKKPPKEVKKVIKAERFLKRSLYRL